MKEHIERVHEQKKNFKCNICDVSFKSRQGLTRHILAVHEGKKLFECNYCEKKFASDQCLKRHISRVHEGNANFECSTCKKVFHQMHDLKKHMTLSASRPFKCEICCARFGFSAKKDAHIKSVYNT
jgi:uncharacterized C2H2 Zn-finger protein